jgi:hypothetical protein
MLGESEYAMIIAESSAADPRQYHTEPDADPDSSFNLHADLDPESLTFHTSIFSLQSS